MELARVGLAAKGRAARRELPAVDHELRLKRQALEDVDRRSRALLDERRREHEAAGQRLAAIEQEIQRRQEVLRSGQLERQAQQLRQEVQALQAERDALREPQRPRMRPR